MSVDGKIAMAAGLGTRHGAAGEEPFGDLDAGGEALLMDALGETSETTADNVAFRESLLVAYKSAYEAARQ